MSCLLHRFRLRTSRTYRVRHLENKRIALGAVHGLPARYAQLPPLLSDQFTAWVKSL